MPTALAVSPGRQVRPRINESLKGIVRQWWMVKRFTLPPPLYKKVPEGPAKVLDEKVRPQMIWGTLCYRQESWVSIGPFSAVGSHTSSVT